MDGIDVSSWQPGNVVASVPHDFAIVKSTQGQGYKSPTFDQQIQDALRTGKAGAYHFDNGDANWRGEVDNFVRVIRPYLGRIVVVWDWEASAINAGSGRLSAILGYLREQIGFPPMLYASGSPLVSQGGNAAAAANNCGVWCANYVLGYEKTGYRSDLKPYTACVIHQYSSSGRLPGYGGNLDLNRFFGDGRVWDAYATGKPLDGSAPAPAPVPARKTDQEVAQDIVNGVGGWGDGQDRKNRLAAAGYDYGTVQGIVNQLVGVPAAPARKSNEQIAQEVLHGDWGNGQDRVNRLQAAGYDYNAVQAIVNGQAPAPAAPQDQYFTIPSGVDGYLSNIASRFGTSVAQLVAWNKGKYPSMTANYVQAGWVIRVK